MDYGCSQNTYKDVNNRYKLITMGTATAQVQIHSPTLETVQMVEDTIRKVKGTIKIAQLKRKLPRQVNHNTLKVILKYLQESGKVEFTVDGVVWIFMPIEDIAAVLSKGRTWS